MEKTIIRYYRKGGKLRGCVVGILSDGMLKTGWSLYHKRLERAAGIPFTKKEARERALDRTKNVPQSLLATYMQVREQAKRIQKRMSGGDEYAGEGNKREDATSTDKD